MSGLSHAPSGALSGTKGRAVCHPHDEAAASGEARDEAAGRRARAEHDRLIGGSPSRPGVPGPDHGTTAASVEAPALLLGRAEPDDAGPEPRGEAAADAPGDASGVGMASRTEV